MKAENVSQFRPVHITLTIETKEELDALASVLNNTPVADGFRAIGVEVGPLREALTKYFEIGRSFLAHAKSY